MTFESGMEKLESIVRAMESGDMPLEESFQAYEDGMKIAKELKNILKAGDERIRVLTESGEREMDA